MMIAAGKTRTDIENFLGDIGFEPEVVELKISDVITNGIDSHTVTLPDNTQYTVPEEK
jgi:hypothetical protein